MAKKTAKKTAKKATAKRAAIRPAKVNRRDLTERNLDAQKKRNSALGTAVNDLRALVGDLTRRVAKLEAGRSVFS